MKRKSFAKGAGHVKKSALPKPKPRSINYSRISEEMLIEKLRTENKLYELGYLLASIGDRKYTPKGERLVGAQVQRILRTHPGNAIRGTAALLLGKLGRSEAIGDLLKLIHLEIPLSHYAVQGLYEISKKHPEAFDLKAIKENTAGFHNPHSERLFNEHLFPELKKRKIELALKELEAKHP